MFEFPMREVNVKIPKWMQVLPCDSPIIKEVIDKIKEKYKQNVIELKRNINNEKSDAYAWLNNADNDRKEFFFVAFAQDGVESGGTYIYVISQIEPITSVVVVLQRQFLFSSAFL